MNNEEIQKFLESLTDEQKQQLVAGMFTGTKVEKHEGLDGPAVVSTPKPHRRVNEDFTVERTNNINQTAGRRPVQAGKNMWKDKGENRDEDFDPEIFEKQGKAERRKAQPQKVELQCHICGRSFKVQANHVYGEFVRCNRCTGR